MNKLRRLLPNREFSDDLAQPAQYSGPVVTHTGGGGSSSGVPAILDPRLSGLGLQWGHEWSPEWVESIPPIYHNSPHPGGWSAGWASDEQYSPQRVPLTMPTGPTVSKMSSGNSLNGPRPQSRAPTPLRSRAVYSPRPKNSPRMVYDVADFEVHTEMEDPEFPIYLKPKFADRMRTRIRRMRKDRMVDEPSEPVEEVVETEVENEEPPADAVSSAMLIRTLARKTVVMRPLDALADIYPQIIGLVLLIETIMVMFAMYEVYIFLDGVFQTIRALCLPLILLARMVGVN